jgi:hypothetical protein
VGQMRREVASLIPKSCPQLRLTTPGKLAAAAAQMRSLAALETDQPCDRTATRPDDTVQLALGATRFHFAGSQADAVPR